MSAARPMLKYFFGTRSSPSSEVQDPALFSLAAQIAEAQGSPKAAEWKKKSAELDAGYQVDQ